MNAFFDPSRMAYVDDVKFRLTVRGEKVKTGRRVLVISLHGLGDKTALREAYLREFCDHVSFPLKERAKHLMTRIDQRIFNFGRFIINWIPRFRRKPYQLPRSRTLEVVVRLKPEESAKLQTYLRNIIRRRARTIGKFHMDGHQFTTGKIDRNVTLKGGHNCSSWIGTAPLGPKDEPLLELLGGDRRLEISTNPGWWTNWLTATAPQERVPEVLLWTPLPLAEELARVQPGQNLAWDFNRH